MEGYILPKEQREHVHDLKMTCVLAIEILDDLLLYEKIERGQVSLELRSVKPMGFLRRILAAYARAEEVCSAARDSRRLRYEIDFD
jgi:signal transduction histidine kinase